MRAKRSFTGGRRRWRRVQQSYVVIAPAALSGTMSLAGYRRGSGEWLRLKWREKESGENVDKHGISVLLGARRFHPRRGTLRRPRWSAGRAPATLRVCPCSELRDRVFFREGRLQMSPLTSSSVPSASLSDPVIAPDRRSSGRDWEREADSPA